MKSSTFIVVAIAHLCVVVIACSPPKGASSSAPKDDRVKPVLVSEKVFDDSDDPAIWIDKKNKKQSLVLGTDKHVDSGGVYVFTLDGKIDRKRSLTGLKRMNNVDIAYELKTGDSTIDIAVATERDRNMLRIFKLPEMKIIDGGGIEVFRNEQQRSPMGIALYTRPSDHAIFAIVSRKTGSTESYLEQYQLTVKVDGIVQAELVRRFGKFSGKKEIESIAVDNELGYVYYSDEMFAIRKYYADPEKGNEELAAFGKGEYLEDCEGISIYKFDDGTGYILVSDQGANKFNVYPREGTKDNLHQHTRITSIPISTNFSDGSDVTSVSLPGFKGGLFVAMSDDATFHFYSWKDIARKASLKIKR